LHFNLYSLTCRWFAPRHPLYQDQADLLVFSRVKGQPSVDLDKLSGHAYMSGADSWVDLERALGELLCMLLCPGLFCLQVLLAPRLGVRPRCLVASTDVVQPVFYTTTVVATGLSITQPDKIHLQETSDPNWANALALLKGLREAFAVHESAFTKLLKQATSENKLSKVR
jgi:hypothetical protein